MKRLLLALTLLVAPLSAQLPDAYLQPLFDPAGCMVQPQAPACQPDNPVSDQWLIWAHGKDLRTQAFSYILAYADSAGVNHSLTGVFAGNGTKMVISAPLSLGKDISAIDLSVTELIPAMVSQRFARPALSAEPLR